MPEQLWSWPATSAQLLDNVLLIRAVGKDAPSEHSCASQSDSHRVSIIKVARLLSLGVVALVQTALCVSPFGLSILCDSGLWLHVGVWCCAAKFVCVKGVVFFTFWQQSLLSTLAFFNVFTMNHRWNCYANMHEMINGIQVSTAHLQHALRAVVINHACHDDAAVL